MKKRYIGFAGLGLVLALGTQQVHAQQGFGTDKPAKSAAVDIQSSKRGLLIPRVNLTSTVDNTTIDSPAQSLMVYNQVTNAKDSATEVTPGYYYWDTNRWVRFAQQGDISAINLGGDVTGPTNATVVGAIQGVEVSNVNPTANQVLTLINGVWTPTSITPDVITDKKGITGTGITVSGETNGANSTLKDVTLAITPGKPNFVMVTNEDGNGTTWVDRSTIAPATTHTVVKDATGNTLTSTVNGESASVNLVDSVSNTVTGTTIKTSVNGVESVGVDLKDAIQAGQKITTIVDGLNTTVTSVNPTGSNTTEYKVNVSNEAIQDAQKTSSVVGKDNKVSVTSGITGNNTQYTVGVEQGNLDLSLIGGSLTPGQIAPGTEGQVLTTVPPKAGTTTPSVEWQTPAEQKITTVSQGTGVKVTPTTPAGSNTTDYKVAINTDGGQPGDVLTVVDGGTTTGGNTVEWKTPVAHQNIYTHNGTLTADRTVDYGAAEKMTFEKKSGTDNQRFVFNLNGIHTALNMYGKNGSMIQLIGNEGPGQGSLEMSQSSTASAITSNATNGLNIITENDKNVTFKTFHYPGNEAPSVEKTNFVVQGDGGVKVVNINKPAFKGAAADKVVVADADGVLKTVERKKVAPQFFYMPAVIFNTKTAGRDLKRDLYQDYVNQFTAAENTAYNIAHGANGGSLPYDGGVIGSTGAPVKIDTFERGELYYYVTYYDKNVFANISINANGELKYDIIGTATPASYMNIVFVIK